jgi:polygalacturonase
MVDSNDDMLCVKSGADWLGRQAGVPSENILFEDCEIRSGHGLTLGSEMSGGVRNVTYRNIFYNASASCTNADPRNCGAAKPHSDPGGVHFKTQRGRGGYLIDIMVRVQLQFRCGTLIVW